VTRLGKGRAGHGLDTSTNGNWARTGHEHEWELGTDWARARAGTGHGLGTGTGGTRHELGTITSRTGHRTGHGRGRWNNGWPLLVYDGGWTTTISASARCTNQDLISTKHHSRSKGRNDDRIASLSHRTRGRYKNLPPPTTERTDGYIEEHVFGNFQNFREPRFKMLKPGFWVFSPSSGKGVNTRTDNLRVHMAGSDTRTTSVGTTPRSGWLEWHSHGCLKVTGNIY